MLVMTTTQPDGPVIGMIGTFPPTQCGLATFTAALATAMSTSGRPPVEVIEVTDRPHVGDAAVVHQVVHGDRESIRDARRWLGKFDAVIVQHEFGIFGGPDGSEVLDILYGCAIPIVVVLHTVVERPSPRQRHIVWCLTDLASAIVVMTEAARSRLAHVFGVSGDRVQVIPHGAHENPAQPGDRDPARRPTILSWGLLGPGKGLEAAIDAMAELRDLIPAPRYVIAGETHPKVKAASGEAYRRSLRDRAVRMGVDRLVEFDDQYRDVASLNDLIRAADVVVIPYESRDQVTSGVLIEAVASGRPVVATDFPHARELLASGAGIVVEHDSTTALAAAIRRVLTDHGVAARMSAEATRLSGPMLWSTVGRQYLQLIDDLVVAATTTRRCAA